MVWGSSRSLIAFTWGRASWLRWSILSLMLIPAEVDAQSVIGTVVEEGTGHPIPGVLVTLWDAEGQRIAAQISDGHGRVLLTARTPGSYTVRTERIGFRTVEMPDLVLTAGESVSRRIQVPAEAIGLEGIVVRSDRRCVHRPEYGLATAMLWDEARKALDALVQTEREQVYRYRAYRYQRSLDPASLRVRHENLDGGSWWAAVPFESLPATELTGAGFIQKRDDGTFFYAPDAAVLLSEEFLDAYCFRARTAPPEAPGLVGLAFEPVRGTRVPAIEGALWLDERTGELRFAEFSYLRAPGPRDRRVGGRVEFVRLPAGVWIVQRWWIRMPEIVVREARDLRGNIAMRDDLGGLTESGAVVVAVDDPSGRRIDTTARSTIRGIVREPATGEPLSGATVRLVGTVHSARADAAGRFALEGLFEGRWGLTYNHPRLDAFGFRPDTLEVATTRGGVLDVELDAPSRPTLIETACPDLPEDQLKRERGLMVGVVLDHDTGRRLEGALVRAVWTRYVEVDPIQERIDSELPESVAETDSAGNYRLCGLPVDHPMVLRIRPPGGDWDEWSRPIPSRIRTPDGVVERDLEARRVPIPIDEPDSMAISGRMED